MVAFAFIAEEGVLERQACLLAESIRLFAGAYRNARMLIVSPRPQRRPSLMGREALRALGAEYLALDIESAAPEYGTSFRVHAASILERQAGDDVLVFLDSDMIITGEPDLRLEESSIAARPVDLKGMCTTGADDPCDLYWRALCATCGVDYDVIPYVITTIDGLSVKASYNGGFIAARTSSGVFQRTEDFFMRSVAAGLRPWGEGAQLRSGHGMVRGLGAQFWGSSQACLSLAVWGVGGSVRVLPPSHNFPAHIEDHVARAGMREPLVSVHYHHLFDSDGDASVHRRLNLAPDCRAWLEERVPIQA